MEVTSAGVMRLVPLPSVATLAAQAATYGGPSPTFALELGVSEEGEAASMHAFGTLAPSAARLHGVLVQIGGQPAQVAVADERITCQVPAWHKLLASSWRPQAPNRCAQGAKDRLMWNHHRAKYEMELPGTCRWHLLFSSGILKLFNLENASLF